MKWNKLSGGIVYTAAEENGRKKTIRAVHVVYDQPMMFCPILHVFVFFLDAFQLSNYNLIAINGFELECFFFYLTSNCMPYKLNWK